jgi:chromosomal replication initiator protein
MNKTYKEIWNNCLQIIRDNIPVSSYKTWFEPIVPLKLEEQILTIQVPSPFFYEYLEEHFIDLLRKVLRRELGAEAKLEYSIVLDNNLTNKKVQNSYNLPGKVTGNLENQAISLPSQQNAIKNPFIIPGIKKIHVNPQLNLNYTFDNFIEGDCNRLGKSAGFAITESPGQTPFNPLLIYGDSGLGKTHLAQAIGIAIKEKFPEKIVLYVTAYKFQTQYTEAVRNNNRNDFMHFYQMIDVLIIDDIHELAGKDATQDTFFHIFNHLHQSGKQLIITSDRPPVELSNLKKRLLSRFKWGLVADLQTPDYETRLSILKKKAYNDGLEIPMEILEYIAENVTTNIRELEGSLVSLLAQSTLNRQIITLELAKNILEKMIKRQRKELSIDYIQKVVCDYFDIDPKVLHARTRKREIVQARQIAMYFSKNMTNASLSTIGSEIGGKDHSTVLHAYKTVKDLIDTDKNFKNFVDDIERQLKY